jgi:hypothetical protein
MQYIVTWKNLLINVAIDFGHASISPYVVYHFDLEFIVYSYWIKKLHLCCTYRLFKELILNLWFLQTHKRLLIKKNTSFLYMLLHA